MDSNFINTILLPLLEFLGLGLLLSSSLVHLIENRESERYLVNFFSKYKKLKITIILGGALLTFLYIRQIIKGKSIFIQMAISVVFLIFIFLLSLCVKHLDDKLQKTSFGRRYGKFILMLIISLVINICLMLGHFAWQLSGFEIIYEDALFLHLICIVTYLETMVFMTYTIVINCYLRKPEPLRTKIIIITVMIADIIFSLTNLVATIHNYDHSSFNGIKSYFDALYFTIITFTTIGYGDITPNGMLGKLGAMIISISSMFTLILFITAYMQNVSTEKA